jgi:hypothetical protein
MGGTEGFSREMIAKARMAMDLPETLSHRRRFVIPCRLAERRTIKR